MTLFSNKKNAIYVHKVNFEKVDAAFGIDDRHPECIPMINYESHKTSSIDSILNRSDFKNIN